MTVEVPFVPFVIVTVLGLGLFITLTHSYAQQRKKRTADLKMLAASKGYQFQPVGSVSDLGLHREVFPVIEIHREPLKNLMFGSQAGSMVAVFNFSYSTGVHSSRSGGGSISEYTVVFLKDSGLSLPRFSLTGVDPLLEKYYGKDSVIYKIASFANAIPEAKFLSFGKKITMDEDKRFSELYRLEGEDPLAIKKLFNRDVISFFLYVHPILNASTEEINKMKHHKKLGLTTHGFKEQIVMFYRRYLGIEEIRALLEQSQKVLGLFKKAQSR